MVMGAVSDIFKGPPKPDPAPPPPPIEPPPTIEDKTVQDARKVQRRRAVAKSGRDDDIHTSPLGAPSRFDISNRSLLGS